MSATTIPTHSKNHQLNRKVRRIIGKETFQLIKAGQYKATESGKKVDLSKSITKGLMQRIYYLPKSTIDLPPLNSSSSSSTIQFEVRNETTIQSTIRICTDPNYSHLFKTQPTGAKKLELIEDPSELGILNFGSAKNPGGGWQSGSEAQEESVCRASTLFLFIRDSPGYSENRRNRKKLKGFYTDHLSYTPEVRIFRSHAFDKQQPFRLLEPKEVIRAAFVTASAPNCSAIRKSTHFEKIKATLERRIDRILSAFAKHGQTILILGAFGCGVFRNDPTLVATLFKQALTSEKFRDRFKLVVFAIYTRTNRNIKEFQFVFNDQQE